MKRLHRLRPWVLGLACTLGTMLAGAQTSTADKASQQVSDRIAFYEALVAEMSAQRGDGTSAFSLMLDAAQRTKSDALFERAIEIAFAARQANEALQAAQSWAKLRPTSARAHRYGLQILIGLNRLDDIGEPLRQLLRNSNDEERAVHLGLLPSYFVRTADRAAAAQAVQRALAPELSHPRRGPAAWAAVARMQAFAGQEAAALSSLEKAAALDPRSDEAALAALQIGGSTAQAAQALIEQRLLQQPGTALRMAAMRQRIDQRDYAGAYGLLQKLTTDTPDYAEAWLVKGSLEVQNGQPELGEASLQKFLALFDRHAPAASEENAPSTTPRSKVEALLLLATLAERAKDYEKAAAYLDSIYSPAHQSRITVRRASLAAAQGAIEAARALLHELPTNTPDALQLRYGSELQLLREHSLHTEAFAVAGEAALAQPQEPSWRFEQAMSAEKLGRLADMEALLRGLIASHPQYAPPYNALGYSLADRNVHLDEARTLVTKALEFAPDDAYIIDSMGWVEYRSGNLAEARRLLEKAFQSQPDAEIAAHLGEVLWKLGEQVAARALWQQGLQLNAHNATLRETMLRLQGKP